ncbi:HTH-type transcriptional regulator HexR [bioreactor metagenome]|uniref:HTH-type transcriptional regulator HexR n=1 Tax=bioreactor metagenome TaxID=1076179 RepID=A0A645ECB1_9ZZZZ
MPASVFTLIEEKYDDFSKGHKKIAKYILEHYETASFMTAAKLGKAVDISESTVVRFASELGFKGYPDFQEEMQKVLREKLTGVQRIEVAKSQMNSTNVLNSMLGSDAGRIMQTLQNVSKEDFDNAVDIICKARNIYILGVRSSSFLAGFLKYYFKLIFENVMLVDVSSDSEIYEQIFRINEEDVCVAFTFPRYSQQTIHAVRFMKDRDVKVIGFTDKVTSPIAKFADCLLLAQSDMVSVADSIVAPMSLVNALIVAVTLKMGDVVKENYASLERIWDEYHVYDKIEEKKDV